jgi:hypothetical protein
MEILESLPILLKVINLFFYIEFVWQSFSRFVVRCVLICTTDLREKTTAKETTLASKVVITGWNVTSSDTFSTRYVQPRSIFSHLGRELPHVYVFYFSVVLIDQIEH